ncbi:hypothetical protein [Streptomyces sp. NPDC058625]|uniref:hypothetical protein n=1 Tax=Streptomyces sp. NPDC058625 TaxID=3346564 RepID=UPI003658B784
METVRADQLDGRISVCDGAQVVGEADDAEAEQAGLLTGSGVAGGRQTSDASEAFRVGEAHRGVPFGLADGEGRLAAGRPVLGLAHGRGGRAVRRLVEILRGTVARWLICRPWPHSRGTV